MSKWGHFEFAPGAPEGGERLLDEIELSGIVILEKVKRNKKEGFDMRGGGGY